MIRLFFLVAKIRNYADIQKLFKILKVKKAEKEQCNDGQLENNTH